MKKSRSKSTKVCQNEALAKWSERLACLMRCVEMRNLPSDWSANCKDPITDWDVDNRVFFVFF